jgi:hypothetical protein
LLVAPCVAGCEHADDKLQQADTSIDSWEATLSLTESQLADHRVPPVFMKQIAKAAEKALDEQAETVTGTKGGDESRKYELLSNVERVRGHARRLGASTSRGPAS